MVSRIWDKSKPPRGPFTLNRDCPQAQGLVAWWPIGGASGGKFVPDYAGSAHMGVGTSGVRSLGRSGEPSLDLTAASSQYYQSTVIPVTAFPMSASLWFTPRTLGTYWMLGGGNSGDGSQYWGLVLINTGVVRAQLGKDASPDISANTTATVAAGSTNNVIGVFSSATSATVYLNGGNAVTDSANNQTFPTLTNTSLGALCQASNALYMDGALGEAAIWNIALSSDIAARLYDPGKRFELWYPLRSKKWISAGATVYPLSAASGNFALTGTAASLKFNRLLSAASGTFALAGTDAALKANRVLAAASGTVALTGTDATLTYNPVGARTLTAESGTFALAGTAATLKFNRRLSAGSGTFALTGTAASIRANHVLAANAGSIVLTGAPATLTYSGAGAAGPLILAGSMRHAAILSSSARLATTLRGSIAHV